jgi:hypothetical protein
LINIGRIYRENWERKEIKTEEYGQERTEKEETKRTGEKIEIYEPQNDKY